MTTTILQKIGSIKTYPGLLAAYSPRVIRSPAALRQAHAVIERLMAIAKPIASQLDYLELLSTLVEQYESLAHPTPRTSLRSLLAHLIEARGVTAAAVAKATGIQKSLLSEVLSGQRQLSVNNMKRLARYFAVEPGLFLECEE